MAIMPFMGWVMLSAAGKPIPFDCCKYPSLLFLLSHVAVRTRFFFIPHALTIWFFVAMSKFALLAVYLNPCFGF